jgi:hypothetical protein
MGVMTAEAKAAEKRLVEVNNQINNNNKIHKRVTQEIKEREEQLAEAVKNAAGEQREAKKEVTKADRERLEAIREIAEATTELELATQADSSGKIDAQRKLEIEKFKRSEEAKTLEQAGASEERARRIEAINAKYAKQQEDFAERERAKAASKLESQFTAEFGLLQAKGTREEAELKRQYDDGVIGLQDYMSRRKAIMEGETEAQLSSLRQKLDAASAEERPAIELEIATTQVEAQAENDALLAEFDSYAEQRIAKEQSLKDKLFEIKQRAAGGGDDILLQNELELQALDEKHQREIQMLIDYGAQDAEIKDAQAQQDMERNQMVADQETALRELRVGAALQAASDLTVATKNMFGEQSKAAKAAFAVQKSISIAQTIMATYEAAQKAFAAMANIPYVGPVLGGIAAAAAVAAGLARVGQIQAQTLAEGGEVKGKSPHSKADNVPIWATAKEFMQPVSAVQYYGKDVMEGMRRKIFPKEMFRAIPVPSYAAPAVPKRFYAEGGEVSGRRNGGGGSQATQGGGEGVKIMNFIDPQEFLSAIDTPEGTEAVVNIISQNSEKVQRVLK